jgi:hypothetical protein
LTLTLAGCGSTLPRASGTSQASLEASRSVISALKSKGAQGVGRVACTGPNLLQYRCTVSRSDGDLVCDATARVPGEPGQIDYVQCDSPPPGGMRAPTFRVTSGSVRGLPAGLGAFLATPALRPALHRSEN